jgi:ribosomal protein L7/L12
MYNASMSTNLTTQLTAVDAVKFMVVNADFVDHDQLTMQMAASSPKMFMEAMRELIPNFDTSMLLTAAAKTNGAAFMSFLERHVGITKGSEEAVQLLARNEKIQAIKKVRTLYGFGLAEAKHLCDALGDVVREVKDENYVPSVTEYSTFRDAAVNNAFHDLKRVWKSLR